MDIELCADNERIAANKELDLSELEGADNLFLCVQREIFNMALRREFEHSNLSEYRLTFYDS